MYSLWPFFILFFFFARNWKKNLFDVKVAFQVISDYAIDFICRIQRGFSRFCGHLKIIKEEVTRNDYLINNVWLFDWWFVLDLPQCFSCSLGFALSFLPNGAHGYHLKHSGLSHQIFWKNKQQISPCEIQMHKTLLIKKFSMNSFYWKLQPKCVKMLQWHFNWDVSKNT